MSSAAQDKAEPTQQPQQQKPVLEEDDEFEDFPVEGQFSWSLIYRPKAYTNDPRPMTNH